MINLLSKLLDTVPKEFDLNNVYNNFEIVFENNLNTVLR